MEKLFNDACFETVDVNVSKNREQVIFCLEVVDKFIKLEETEKLLNKTSPITCYYSRNYRMWHLN